MKNKFTNDWFIKSSHDLTAAEILLKADHFPDTICFLSHQAIEKQLKGFLVLNKIAPPKTHNLEELIKLCADINKNFLDFIDECGKITAYYIESRYPVSFSQNIKRKDAKEAFETAKELFKFIENILNK